LKFEIVNLKSPWRLALLLCAAVLLCIPAAHAQSKTLRGGLRVDNLSTPFSPHWKHGSGELRYRLTNVSSNTISKVTVSYPSRGYSSGELGGMKRSVALEPGESRTLSLPVPPLNFYANNNVEIAYKGRKEYVSAPARTFRGSPHHYYGSRTADLLPSVLVGHSLNHRDLQTVLDKVAPASHGKTSDGTIKHELGMSDWSSNWTAYGHFDAVVLTAADYNNLPAPAREAVHRYTELGGCLIVIGKTSLPVSWAEKHGGRKTYEYTAGLGTAHQVEGQKIDDVPEAFWRRMMTSTWHADKEENQLMEYNVLRESAKVVDNLSVPVLPLFLLMLGFAILIGPLNLWYLSRRKKRIWMLWTVPVISAITCALVFVFSLLSEGVRPSRSTISYTLLDQSTERAATIGSVGVYAPLTPSAGFHFDYDTEVRPVSSGDMSGEVEYGTDQHYTRGWARARVPIYFQLRRSESTKLRLQVKSLNSKEAEVVNGFGQQLEALWLTDESGAVFHAVNVGAGAKATLTAMGRKAKRASFKGNELAEISIGKFPDAAQLGSFALRKLGPQQYLAVIETDNPMLPKVITAKTKDDRAVIHGSYAAPGGAE